MTNPSSNGESAVSIPANLDVGGRFRLYTEIAGKLSEAEKEGRSTESLQVDHAIVLLALTKTASVLAYRKGLGRIPEALVEKALPFLPETERDSAKLRAARARKKIDQEATQQAALEQKRAAYVGREEAFFKRFDAPLPSGEPLPKTLYSPEFAMAAIEFTRDLGKAIEERLPISPSVKEAFDGDGYLVAGAKRMLVAMPKKMLEESLSQIEEPYRSQDRKRIKEWRTPQAKFDVRHSLIGSASKQLEKMAKPPKPKEDFNMAQTNARGFSLTPALASPLLDREAMHPQNVPLGSRVDTELFYKTALTLMNKLARSSRLYPAARMDREGNSQGHRPQHGHPPLEGISYDQVTVCRSLRSDPLDKPWEITDKPKEMLGLRKAIEARKPEKRAKDLRLLKRIGIEMDRHYSSSGAVSAAEQKQSTGKER